MSFLGSLYGNQKKGSAIALPLHGWASVRSSSKKPHHNWWGLPLCEGITNNDGQSLYLIAPTDDDSPGGYWFGVWG